MNTLADMNRVYDRLIDEESKEIFDYRQAFALKEIGRFDFRKLLSGKSYILQKKFLDWYRDTSDYEYLIVYGAGVVGRYTMDILLDANIQNFMCIDSNVKSKNEYRGINIIPFNDVLDFIENSRVIIASASYRYQIFEQLLRNGYAIKQIYLPDWSELRGYVQNQYFDYFEPNSNEVFIDGGAFDGQTTVDFFNWIGNKSGKSYLFEANPLNKAKIEQTLIDSQINNYHIVLKGLYNECCRKNFHTNGGSGASFNEDGESVELTTLDRVFLAEENETVTFIKMDIEGSEKEALLGAQDLIKRDKPRLAISIYHKPMDYIELPMLLLDINNNYRFAFRHYSTINEETVCYAWVE